MTASAGPYIVALTTARLKWGGLQALAGELDHEPGNGQPDLDLVEADLGRAVGADPQVGRQRHERPGGDGVAGAGGDHRRRKSEIRSASVAPSVSISITCSTSPPAKTFRSNPAEK